MEELKKFVGQATLWKRHFKALVRVALAVKVDNEWALWYSYSAFLPDVPDNVEKLSVETNSVRALRDLLVFEDDDAIAAAISEISTAPDILRTSSWSAKLAPTVGHLSFEYESVHPDRFAGPKRLPALVASWLNQKYRPMSQGQTKHIDQELQLNEQPFDGFADLALALNVPAGFDDLNKRHLSEFVLIPPIDVVFDPKETPHSELKDGELSLVLKAQSSFAPEQLRLGIKAFRQKGVPERLTLKEGEVIRGTDGYLRATHKLASSEVPLVQVFVSVAGDLLGKWFIRDFGSSFNDRMLLHRALDTRDQLKSSFFEKPDQFEDKILLLLTLVGLTALKYGAIQTDAPDILAISSARHVFVVECTTGDINSRGKLQKLSDRTKQIREKLSGSTNPPIGILPVIFTSLPRSETVMHSDTAATFGIALVTRENIVDLLDRLDTQILPEQLYTATLALIPRANTEKS